MAAKGEGVIQFIQVGVMALRDPITRDFLPSVPLYIEATPEAVQSETAMIDDIGGVLARKMKAYIDGGGMIQKKAGRVHTLGKETAGKIRG